VRSRWLLALLALAATSPAAAQTSDRWTLDSAIGVSKWEGQGAADRPDVVIDFTAAARIGNGWSAYVRPWFRKASSSPYDFAKEIYQAALQHERTGAVSTRFEVGYILSPIGLGMMDMRPDTNPTIAPHLSYLIPMPPFERGVPSSMPIASSYPFGAQITATMGTIDVHAAALTSPPNRMFVVGAAQPNPTSRPVIVVGGGITPRTGLRIGAGYADSTYARASEITTAARGDRRSRLMTLEGDLAVNYTRVTGEVALNRLDTNGGHVSATSWFVQGQQTLAPRWFVAGRLEGANAAPSVIGIAAPRLRMAEATVGYRLSPEFTLRGAYSTRRTYFSPATNHQAGVSIVWARRWR
jgi:hypothetical protein